MSEGEVVIARLSRPDDIEGFLAILRYLLYQQIAPNQVHWDEGGKMQDDLFSVHANTIVDRHCADHVAVGSISLPREFIEMVRSVVLHCDTDRLHKLHSMSTLLIKNRQIWSDRTHALRLELERMAREVGREIHKMHAFVRFRPVETDEGKRHIAWFEPAHYIVRAAAPFFAKRFAAMHWAILTPIGCAHWDRQTLAFAPPAQPTAAPPPDAGEALWLAYYRSIFNPARVKVDMMRREMPVRFWKNLPEASAISELLHRAGERTYRMQNEVDQPPRKQRAVQRNLDSEER